MVSKGYSQTRGSNIYRNEVQGGLPRQGRDTYFEAVPISVTLVVSSLGRQAFLSFLNNIHGGADSFIMPHDTGYGVQDHQVMITSTIVDSTDDGINWIITFTATAERTAIQEDNCLTQNLPDLFGCYGDCLEGFLNAYGVSQTTFPRIWSSEGPAGYPPINMQQQSLDGRIAYSGPSVNYLNSSGLLAPSAVNEWPLEYLGGVGRMEPEQASTNLVKFSGDMMNASWVPTRAVRSSGFSAPDGSITAVKIAANSTNSTHYINQSIDKINATTYTYSIFLKAAEHSKALVVLGNFSAQSNPQNVIVDLTNGNIINSADIARVSVIQVGNGWFRISSTATMNDVSGLIYAQVSLIDQSTQSGTFIGDGVSGILAWGAQMEISQKPSSYITTQSSIASRTGASASVFMNGATSINITYSDASVVNVVAVGDYAQIPQANAAWGSKFITRIDFVV